ncbi:hypothetical protein DRE_03174 [Drechslerella stenobrocha 248]|uniref:Uncharacterized protein n=1 Tax=Drechslerella stenobrocha 248 TaxID=1043628 RepID=W7HVL7_9PEZI|nr:hypothetical protein DRE_03174 [Drechslerella stenobrocha 248]
MPLPSKPEGTTVRLILARYESTSRPRTKPIAKDTYLMLLPPGYEMNNKLKIKSSILPTNGNLAVYYIEDSKQTEELLELSKLLSSSPLANAAPPATRNPPPPFEDHIDNIKFVVNGPGDEEEERISSYRHVICHMHAVVTNGLANFINSDTPEDKRSGIAYLESLGRPSPIWEELAKKLLIEEQRVLQELVKEIRGGWNFFKFHLSAKVRVGDYERLAVAAMSEAIDKSPVIRTFHTVAYDVNVEHYVHGRPGECLLPQMEAWIRSPKYLDNDYFRIDSLFVTQTRKHPIQCLDELGERFFRKVIDTSQSGEVLYTRAVLCRSLLITYFFQSFLSVWDTCLLNSHLEAMGNAIFGYPNIIDRLRNNVGRASCPRGGHDVKCGAALSTAGDKNSDADRVTSESRRNLPQVATATSVDIEMVDVSPLSDLSSETIIQNEESKARRPVPTGKYSTKGKKMTRAEKRKRAKQASKKMADQSEAIIGTPDSTPMNTSIEVGKATAPVDDMNKVEVSGQEGVLDVSVKTQSHSLLKDLGVLRDITTSAIKESGATASSEQKPLQQSQQQLARIPTQPVISKSKAKKERRRARAALNPISQKLNDNGSQQENIGAISAVNQEPVSTHLISLGSKAAKMARRRKSPSATEKRIFGAKPARELTLQPKELEGASESAQKSVEASPTDVITKPRYYDDKAAIERAIEDSANEPSAWTEVKSRKEIKTAALETGQSASRTGSSPTRGRRGNGNLGRREYHGQRAKPQSEGSSPPGQAKGPSRDRGHSTRHGRQENKRPLASTQSAKMRREPRLPVLTNLQEFPTLAQSNILLQGGRPRWHVRRHTSNTLYDSSFESDHNVDGIVQGGEQGSATVGATIVAADGEQKATVETTIVAAEEEKEATVTGGRVGTKSGDEHSTKAIPQKVEKGATVAGARVDMKKGDEHSARVIPKEGEKQEHSSSPAVAESSGIGEKSRDDMSTPLEQSPRSSQPERSPVLVLEDRITFTATTKRESKRQGRNYRSKRERQQGDPKPCTSKDRSEGSSVIDITSPKTTGNIEPPANPEQPAAKDRAQKTRSEQKPRKPKVQVSEVSSIDNGDAGKGAEEGPQNKEVQVASTVSDPE